MRKLLPNLFITLAACFCAVMLYQLGLLQRVELTISDYNFKLRGREPVDNRLSLILVDQHTVKKYGFPFSRSYYAVVANALAAAGAKVIAFDYIFDQERLQDELGDQMLVEVTLNNENVIHTWNASLSRNPASSVPAESSVPLPVQGLLTDLKLYSTAGNIYLPYSQLLRASKSLGIISVVPSADGSIRRIPLLVKYGEQSYPSLALLIVCRALDVSPIEVKKHVILKGIEKEINIPIDSMGQMLINYTGDMMSFADTGFSFYDVYESIVSGEPIVPLSVFKDKIVIIGISDPVSSDICSTPLDNLFPGVAVHAMAVNTILRHQFLNEASNLLNLLVLLNFAIVTAIVTVFFRPWLASISAGILMIALWFISYISFSRSGIMLSFIQPAIGVALSFFGTLLYGYMTEIHKERVLRDMFQKYVSPEVIQEIIRQAEHIVPVERRKVTVLFSDLKDSVVWTESLKSEPERLVEELNEYFTEMVDVIFQYGGTLLRFTGDGLFAVYGAPLKHQNPALDAVLTGMEMQCRLEKLNTQRTAVGKQALQMRIGINTGEVIMGNIGSEKRREYGAIGDAVNIAQRTEGECEPGYVTITQDTYQEVKEHVVAEPMGMRNLKGKSESVMLYRVMSSK